VPSQTFGAQGDTPAERGPGFPDGTALFNPIGVSCKGLAHAAKRNRIRLCRLVVRPTLTEGGNEVTHHKHDGTDDRQSLTASEPPTTGAADFFYTTPAGNKRLRDALKAIYTEAMMANEPPASTSYRIAEIADFALSREGAK